MAQYDRRDADYQKWLNGNTVVPLEATVRPFEALREAFNAGWAARKQADYEYRRKGRRANGSINGG